MTPGLRYIRFAPPRTSLEPQLANTRLSGVPARLAAGQSVGRLSVPPSDAGYRSGPDPSVNPGPSKQGRKRGRKEARKRGSKEARKQVSKEASKQATDSRFQESNADLTRKRKHSTSRQQARRFLLPLSPHETSGIWPAGWNGRDLETASAQTRVKTCTNPTPCARFAHLEQDPMWATWSTPSQARPQHADMLGRACALHLYSPSCAHLPLI